MVTIDTKKYSFPTKMKPYVYHCLVVLESISHSISNLTLFGTPISGYNNYFCCYGNMAIMAKMAIPHFPPFTKTAITP